MVRYCRRAPSAAHQFESDVRVQDKSGRHTPFFELQILQFYFRTDVTGTNERGRRRMVMPGDNIKMVVTYITRDGRAVCVPQSAKVAVPTSAGVVAEILG